MADDETLYKRQEDREWRKEVDRDRAMLTTAVNVLQEQHREMRRWQKETDGTLRGHSGHPGLIASYEKLDELYRRLYSVVWQDPTGQKGLLHDVDYLMGRKRRSEEGFARRWTLMEKLLLALVSAITAITVALLAIEPVRKQIGVYIEQRWEAVSPAAKAKAEKAKAKKKGSKKGKRRATQPAPAMEVPTEAPDEPAQEDVQQ